MKKSIVLFVAMLFLMTGYAQEAKNYIEVRGKSEMKVAPDIVNLSITLKEQMDGRDKIQIDKLEAKLLAVLKKNNISKDALAISGQGGIQEKIRRKTTDLMTSKYYTLRITDLTKIDNLLNDIQAIENVSIHQGKTEYSNMPEIKDKLYALAVKDAMHKADVLLNAAAANRGSVIWMEEGYNQFRATPVMAMTKSRSMDSEQSFVDNNVGMAQNTFGFEIRVRFAIEE